MIVKQLKKENSDLKLNNKMNQRKISMQEKQLYK